MTKGGMSLFLPTKSQAPYLIHYRDACLSTRQTVNPCDTVLLHRWRCDQIEADRERTLQSGGCVVHTAHNWRSWRLMAGTQTRHQNRLFRGMQLPASCSGRYILCSRFVCESSRRLPIRSSDHTRPSAWPSLRLDAQANQVSGIQNMLPRWLSCFGSSSQSVPAIAPLVPLHGGVYHFDTGEHIQYSACSSQATVQNETRARTVRIITAP